MEELAGMKIGAIKEFLNEKLPLTKAQKKQVDAFKKKDALLDWVEEEFGE